MFYFTVVAIIAGYAFSLTVFSRSWILQQASTATGLLAPLSVWMHTKRLNGDQKWEYMPVTATCVKNVTNATEYTTWLLHVCYKNGKSGTHFPFFVGTKMFHGEISITKGLNCARDFVLDSNVFITHNSKGLDSYLVLNTLTELGLKPT